MGVIKHPRQTEGLCLEKKALSKRDLSAPRNFTIIIKAFHVYFHFGHWKLQRPDRWVQTAVEKALGVKVAEAKAVVWK